VKVAGNESSLGTKVLLVILLAKCADLPKEYLGKSVHFATYSACLVNFTKYATFGQMLHIWPNVQHVQRGQLHSFGDMHNR